LVQRIRIRSNALSTDSNAANAPSYPSHAVEANPANTIEMANSMGHRIRRHVLSAICRDFGSQRRMAGRGGSFAALPSRSEPPTLVHRQ
jgi:hypothetical protein